MVKIEIQGNEQNHDITVNGKENTMKFRRKINEFAYSRS